MEGYPITTELWCLISCSDGHGHTSDAPELTNFDDNEGYVIGEGALRPPSDAVKNCPPHLG